MKIPPFKLERYFARYEFSAPYLLCSSDCESMTVKELLAFEPDAADQLGELWLGYTECSGAPALREEISRLYQNISPDQILVHSGAEEPIFSFMNVAFEPGDHLIVHYPCYQSLAEIAQANGCEITLWETKPENGWELDLDFLRKHLRPTTKGIVVNCPHNPTGYLMSATTERELIEIARQHNLLLFSDEVYRDLEYSPQDQLPAACELYENAVSLGVMSKAYGLAGLRIGWVATRNRNILAKMAVFKDYTSICNSAPSEFLATLALRHHDQLVARNLEIIQGNLTLLDDFFARHAKIFSWQKPKAGPIAFPTLLLDQDVEDFCQRLVETKGVMLLPSTQYDFGNKNFRLGFGRRNMPKALALLEEFVAEL